MPHDRPATFISDLSQCTPASALVTDQPRKGHWQVIPYEAEGVSGKMLVAGVECNAPTLNLPLNLQGWYAIHLGTWTHWVDSMVKVKLTSDACFTPVATPTPDWHNNWFSSIGEVFWKYADLTGQELLISQMSTGLSWRANIAYVRLEPLSPAEVAALQQERARADTKRLIAYNDAWSFVYSRAPTTKEEIWEEVEPFRDTDFKTLLWGLGEGSATLYLSQVGELMERQGVDDFQRIGDRHAAESFRTLKRQGIDPLRTVIDHAHSMGLELHGSYRVGGWSVPPPEHSEDRFYRQHPEWRCVDRDGRSISRMSYAYPGVQEFIISLLQEVVERGADGVNLAFIRGVPSVLYEPPLVAGFQGQYGQDPRQLAEDDPRWLQYKAGWITSFMRLLRRKMDEVGKQQGRHIQVSATVMNPVAYCLTFGLDVATWAREGLVDFLISNPWHGPPELDIASFMAATQDTTCQVYAEMLPRKMPPEEYRQRAMANYTLGVAGLAFWDTDTENRLALKDQWSMVRRLGHEEQLAGWTGDQWPAYRQVPLHTLGGHTMDKYSPYWSA
ncbi:MAG: hypothetical protein EXR62_03445 [Chloroflexi bacterium]|nr:hypothetical protein [Chloroflexota bacterium]